MKLYCNISFIFANVDYFEDIGIKIEMVYGYLLEIVVKCDKVISLISMKCKLVGEKTFPCFYNYIKLYRSYESILDLVEESVKLVSIRLLLNKVKYVIR